MSAKTDTFVFPRPGSPTKQDLRPNAHPYPIKTTSTGVLSRHNSTSSSTSATTAHHYIPSPSPSPSRKSTATKMNGHGHRYSRSLSLSDGPRPLPVPPSPSKSSSNGFSEPSTPSDIASPTQLSKRVNALPTPPGGVQRKPLSVLEDLPPNPKSWTPSQLSLYLSTTLRVRSGETMQLPVPIAQDIANFVRESEINGRSFIRMKEEDLEQFDINKLWRSALLSASRSLRESVLKGRIWGFGNNVEDSSCSPITTSSNDDGTPHRRRRSTSLHETPSENAFVNGSASSSVEDLPDGTPIRGNSGKGRRIAGRTGNGRVKGMVENLERSGSIYDDLTSRRERSNSSASSGSSLYDTAEGTESSYATATARPSLARPLPAPPSESSVFSNSGDSDELSMDELLHKAGIFPKDVQSPTAEESHTYVNKRRSRRRGDRSVIGVQAWEAGTEDRVTVKRVMPIPGASLEDVFAMSPLISPVPASPSKVDAAIEPMMFASPLDEDKLEIELEETKRLIGNLRKRIEIVEKKVNNMEIQELEREEREREAERKASLQPSSPPNAASPSPLFSPNSILGKVFIKIFGDSALPDLQRFKFFTSSYYERLVEPTSLRGIPPYVFLVGLGVCAVVFKVLIRKGAAIGLVTRRR